MSKKFVDEFVKLPVTKMAQKISDMTYAFKCTEVPKAHYQKLLNQEMLEMLAQSSTMECVLLNAVMGQLQALRKESPGIFQKALICMEKGIKVENINERIYDSLQMAVVSHDNPDTITNQDLLEQYDLAFENHKEISNGDDCDEETLKEFLN